jgi:hypothetical protein
MNAASRCILVFITREFNADLGVNSQFLSQLANQSLLRTFTLFHFAARKFPFERMATAFAALANQYSPAA